MRPFTKSKGKTDLEYFMRLYALAKWLGLAPYKKVYSTILIVLLAMGYLYSLIGRTQDLYYLYSHSAVFLDSSSYTILTALNILTISRFTMCHPSQLHLFLEEASKTRAIKTGSSASLPVIAVHLYFLSFFTANVSYWMQSVGMFSYQFYVLKELQQYHVVIFVLFMYNYFMILYRRVRDVNAELLRSAGFYAKTVSGRVFFSKRIVLLVRTYLGLLDLVKVLNHVFGWPILLLSIRTVLDVLTPLNMILLLSSGDVSVPILAKIICLGLLWCSLSWILITLLATSCNRLTKEAKKTMAILYKIMHDVRRTPESRKVHVQLFLLAHQIHVTSPHVTAAGFFRVDYTMLLAMTGSVTSYLIVLIQLDRFKVKNLGNMEL